MIILHAALIEDELLLWGEQPSVGKFPTLSGRGAVSRRHQTDLCGRLSSRVGSLSRRAPSGSRQIFDTAKTQTTEEVLIHRTSLLDHDAHLIMETLKYFNFQLIPLKAPSPLWGEGWGEGKGVIEKRGV